MRDTRLIIDGVFSFYTFVEWTFCGLVSDVYSSSAFRRQLSAMTRHSLSQPQGLKVPLPVRCQKLTSSDRLRRKRNQSSSVTPIQSFMESP